MTMTVAMADHRVGIVHGDPDSLAGWGFAVESMSPADEALRRRMGCGQVEGLTSISRIEEYFRVARVSVFAAAHTGLPFMQDFTVDTAKRLVVNNGTAGMPNFRNAQYGVVTRISVDQKPPPMSLYGARIGELRCDALPVEYDYTEWQRRFLDAWPAESPGHALYWDRIRFGPDFDLDEAIRLRPV